MKLLNKSTNLLYRGTQSENKTKISPIFTAEVCKQFCRIILNLNSPRHHDFYVQNTLFKLTWATTAPSPANTANIIRATSFIFSVTSCANKNSNRIFFYSNERFNEFNEQSNYKIQRTNFSCFCVDSTSKSNILIEFIAYGWVDNVNNCLTGIPTVFISYFAEKDWYIPHNLNILAD